MHNKIPDDDDDNNNNFLMALQPIVGLYFAVL
jgi:hypothetical protein